MRLKPRLLIGYLEASTVLCQSKAADRQASGWVRVLLSRTPATSLALCLGNKSCQNKCARPVIRVGVSLSGKGR